MLDVDPAGLDLMDRKLLSAVIDKFGGGPVGVDNLAAAIGEARDTIEDVLEPYLIQQGYLQRTLRGRIATRPSTAISASPSRGQRGGARLVGRYLGRTIAGAAQSARPNTFLAWKQTVTNHCCDAR